MKTYPGRLHHTVPGWVKTGASFHVRIRIDKTQLIPLTDQTLSPALLESVQRYHNLGHWWCELVLLMPDHLHALLSFPQTTSLAATIRNWKRGTARFQTMKWQTDFFDRRIRNDTEQAETWTYILQNPVVKNLCSTPADWPHSWSSFPPTPSAPTGGAR